MWHLLLRLLFCPISASLVSHCECELNPVPRGMFRTPALLFRVPALAARETLVGFIWECTSTWRVGYLL